MQTLTEDEPHICRSPEQIIQEKDKNVIDELIKGLNATSAHRNLAEEEIVSCEIAPIEKSPKITHDLACEHSYARSAGSKKSDRWSENDATSPNTLEAEEGNLLIEDSTLSAKPNHELHDENAADIGIEQMEVKTEQSIRKTDEEATSEKNVEKVKTVNLSLENVESRSVKSVRSELLRLISSDFIKPSSGRRSVDRLPIEHEILSSTVKVNGKKRSISSDVVDETFYFLKDEPTKKRVIKKQRLNPIAIKAQMKNAEVESDNEEFRGWDSLEVAETTNVSKIPYQPAKVLPPAPDFKLWIYKTICNIAFAKSRHGFIYKCLIRGCRFQTLVKETLKNHLENKHIKQEWNGFCNICTKVKTGRRTILDEFQHMHELHIEFGVCTVEKSSSFVKSPAKFVQQRNNKSLSPVFISSPSVESPQSMDPKLSPQTPSPSARKFLETLPDIKLQSLRPWLKEESVQLKPNELREVMLSKEALCARFKCMSSTCSFFTIDENLFRKHLKFHEKFTSADKSSFLSCSNCEFKGSTSDELVKHIDDFHVYDRFQCNYCFYRSCMDFNVLTHQIMMHRGIENVIIECPELKERDRQAELDVVKNCRVANVPPMICVFCRGIFYGKEAFLDHMSKHAENLRARCITCGEKATNKTIEKHLEKCHGVGLYHCVYCVLGTDTFETLNNHIANDHPSRLPVFCERTEHRNQDGTLKYVSFFFILFVACQHFLFKISFLAFTFSHRNDLPQKH